MLALSGKGQPDNLRSNMADCYPSYIAPQYPISEDKNDRYFKKAPIL